MATEMSPPKAQKGMTPRERVLAAIDGRRPDRVPRALGFGPVALMDLSAEETSERFGLEMRFVTFEPARRDAELKAYLRSLLPDVDVGNLAQLRAYDEWGYHPGVREVNPLAEAQTVEDVARHRLPDLGAEYRHRALGAQVRSLHERGLAVGGEVPHLGGLLFEAAWRLRGFETFMEDLILRPQLADYLIGTLADICAHSSAILAVADVDLLMLDDDIAHPTGLMISPAAWRRFVRPGLVKVIKAARAVKPGLRVFYHSDGNFEAIVPDLIEAGVNVLNPVQPDHMDPERLKRLYGDRVAIWGAVGSQTLMSHGRPEDVRREVKRRIKTLAAHGGYIVCPAYDIDYAVPKENLLAFLEAVDAYGG